jgi:hypothetical protein
MVRAGLVAHRRGPLRAPRPVLLQVALPLAQGAAILRALLQVRLPAVDTPPLN